MENVIWVDKNDNELGVVPIEKAHREGLCDRIVVVYVTRPNGDILVQDRADGRLDHSCAGHVEPGESYMAAAVRELHEELGVTAALTEVGKGISGEKKLRTQGYNVCHLFTIFMCEAEPGVLAKDEIRRVYWENPQAVFQKMLADSAEKKYCGAFKASLKIYFYFLRKKGGLL